MKLEPPGEGDPGRHIGLGEQDQSVFFRNLNRGKKSIRLNLKSAAGREALLRVAAGVDVIIEAFRPGVAARIGVGANELPTVTPAPFPLRLQSQVGHRPERFARRPCRAKRFDDHHQVIEGFERISHRLRKDANAAAGDEQVPARRRALGISRFRRGVHRARPPVRTG
jgi:hypothetical protein